MMSKIEIKGLFGLITIIALSATLLTANTSFAQSLSLTSPTSPIGQRGLAYKGEPVFLVGSGSFWLLSDPYYYTDNGVTDIERLTDHLDKYSPADPLGTARGVIRASAFGTLVRYSGVDGSRKKYPCARTDVAGARDGGNKFDCSRMDQSYFDHVLTVTREADKRGIVLGIILWDEISIEESEKRWGHNPFCPENSVVDYGLASCGSSGIPSFYDTANDTLRNHQRQIIDKFVATLKDEPNVFFFISNEYTGGSEWWDAQTVDIDQANETFNTDILHVMMEYGPGPDVSSLSDGISPDTNGDGLGKHSYRDDGRPSIAQRDYRPVSGADVRRNNWSRFMDGAASAGTRDDYNGDTPPETTFSTARVEDEQLRRFVNSIDSGLDLMAPSDAVFGPDWSGRGIESSEYVAFTSSSPGAITIDLSDQTGTWILYEWDTASDSGPESRGEQEGGKAVTWNLVYPESAVRIVRVDGQLVRPNPPLNLTIEE